MSFANHTLKESNYEEQISQESEALEENSDKNNLKTLMILVPIIVPVIFSFIIIIGFIGNSLVVIVIIFNKSIRTTTNILILNLAVSYNPGE